MAKVVEGTPINLRDKVAVKAIQHKDPKKQKFTVGKVYKVHPTVAENLVETGHAVLVKESAKD